MSYTSKIIQKKNKKIFTPNRGELYEDADGNVFITIESNPDKVTSICVFSFQENRTIDSGLIYSHTDNETFLFTGKLILEQ